MRKLIKRLVIGLAILGILLGIAAFALHGVGASRLATAPVVATQPVGVPSGDEAIARGKHLASVSSCSKCHGPGLGGAVFIDQPPIGYLPAPNLTAGKGGVGKFYTDEDWERAIRHGVAKDGRTIVIMPADHYSGYGDDDLGALIAYMRSLPPVDNEIGSRDIPFPGTVILGVLAYGRWPVSTIRHEEVGGPAPVLAASAEYGEYLVSLAACRGCHGEALAGAEGAGGGPAAPNLTPAGRLKAWSREDFAAAIQTGLTPDDRVLDKEMPWRNYARLTDMEVDALWAYLGTLEPLEPDG